MEGLPPISNRGVKSSPRGARVVLILYHIVAKGYVLTDIRPPECGFDYLTTTWKDRIRDTALGSARSVIKWAERRQVREGGKNFTKPWAWQGYTGYQCGQVCVGERPDSSIVRLTGKAAHDWASDGLPTGHNISRLDISLTIWGVLDQSELIARHNVESVDYRKSLRSRPYAVSRIDGNGDGDTLYLGSRTSEQFVRIYDKERAPNSDNSYKTALRYECECKEQLALSAYQGCVNPRYSATSCLSVLTGLLARRGVSPALVGSIQSKPIAITGVPISDLESTLSWLKVQVKPTVSRLMREGFEEEVLIALGLQRYFNNGY
jgi:hypothetical protein